MSRPIRNLQGHAGVTNSKVEVERIVFCPAIVFVFVFFFFLTNRPQFSLVYILIDRRNDVIKCSKLKWNHEPQVVSLQSFELLWRHFYGL